MALQRSRLGQGRLVAAVLRKLARSGITEGVWRKILEFPAAARGLKTPSAVSLAALCAVGLILNIGTAVLNRTGWGIDYNQFYSASRLAGTGHAYDWDALRKLEVENGIEIPTGRLPVVLYGHRILSSLPYPIARAVWTACGIAALIGFAALWPAAPPLLMIVAVAWSIPATLTLLYGQDLPFWLLSFSAGLLMLQRKRPVSAGVAFSLCICKFHLALGIPVMLAAQKRWKTLFAGAIAVSAWGALCFAIEGPGWVAEHAKMTHLPVFSPAPERMPNLRGIAASLPWPPAAEIVLAVCLMLLLWAVCRCNSDFGLAGAAAAACGLLAGHHAYANDCTLLIPLSVLTIGRPGAPPWLKVWGIVMLTPVSTLLLVSGKPLLGQILIAAFVATAVLAGRANPLGRVAAQAA